jgi:glycerol-3-phosphate dehydrogenase
MSIDDPEAAVCDEDEVTYILNSIREVFPNITVNESHIVYRFCGVRPLPRSDAVTTGQISRDRYTHIIPRRDGLAFPIYCLVGGKWTTFRSFAEDVAGELLVALGIPRKVSTVNMPIGGGKNFPADEKERALWIRNMVSNSNLPLVRIANLVERYGSRCEEVIKFTSATVDQSLRNDPSYTVGEIRFMVEHERALHIEDVILRRTVLAMLGRLNSALVREIGTIMAECLEWSQEELEKEIGRTLSSLEIRSRVHLMPK